MWLGRKVVKKLDESIHNMVSVVEPIDVLVNTERGSRVIVANVIAHEVIVRFGRS